MKTLLMDYFGAETVFGRYWPEKPVCEYINITDQPTEELYEIRKMVSGFYNLPEVIRDILSVVSLAFDRPHYPRLTNQNPDIVMIAKKGQPERYERIKIGRYLRKALPEMAERERKALSELYTASNPSQGISIHTVQNAEIVEVMRDHCGRASSCMTGRSGYEWGDYFDTDDLHPYMVYQNSGISLALVVSKGEIVARSLYSDKNKSFVRIYGHDPYSEYLSAWFADNGYHKSDSALNGHKLKQITLPSGGYLMPYLDGHGRVDLDNMTIDNGGGYNTQADSHYTRCDTGDGFNGHVCDHCGERINEDDGLVPDGGEIFCDHTCAESAGHYYAYVGRYQEWVSEQQNGVYQYQGDYYTAEGLDYHNLYICERCGDVQDADEGILEHEGDGMFYCSEFCATRDGLSLRWVRD